MPAIQNMAYPELDREVPPPGLGLQSPHQDNTPADNHGSKKQMQPQESEENASWLGPRTLGAPGITPKAGADTNIQENDDPLSPGLVEDITFYATWIRYKRDHGLKPTSSDGTISCRLSEKFMRGSFNVIRFIIFEDGVQWVWKRDSRASSEPQSWTAAQADHMLRTARLMGMIKKRTTIPVPEVYDVQTGFDNAAKCPFILMECIQGQTLHSLLHSKLPGSDRSSTMFRTLFDLAKIVFKLYQVGSFPTIGAPVYSHDGELVDIAPPFTASGRTVPMFPSGQSSMEYSLRNFRSQLFPSAEGVMLHTFLQWMGEASTSSGFRLFHPDLHGSNIMVSPDGHVTGIIDWDFCQTGPSYLGLEGYPRLLGERWHDCAFIPDKEDPDMGLYRAAWRRLMDYIPQKMVAFSSIDYIPEPRLKNIAMAADADLNSLPTPYDQSVSLMQFWYGLQGDLLCACNNFVENLLELMHLRDQALDDEKHAELGLPRMHNPVHLLIIIRHGRISDAHLRVMKHHFQRLVHYPNLIRRDVRGKEPMLLNRSAQYELEQIFDVYNRIGEPASCSQAYCSHELPQQEEHLEQNHHEGRECHEECSEAQDRVAQYVKEWGSLDYALGSVDAVQDADEAKTAWGAIANTAPSTERQSLADNESDESTASSIESHGVDDSFDHIQSESSKTSLNVSAQVVIDEPQHVEESIESISITKRVVDATTKLKKGLGAGAKRLSRPKPKDRKVQSNEASDKGEPTQDESSERTTNQTQMRAKCETGKEQLELHSTQEVWKERSKTDCPAQFPVPQKPTRKRDRLRAKFGRACEKINQRYAILPFA